LGGWRDSVELKIIVVFLTSGMEDVLPIIEEPTRDIYYIHKPESITVMPPRGKRRKLWRHFISARELQRPMVALKRLGIRCNH
jgi:hypothetical protein